jgi:hypothetical protein
MFRGMEMSRRSLQENLITRHFVFSTWTSGGYWRVIDSVCERREYESTRLEGTHTISSIIPTTV